MMMIRHRTAFTPWHALILCVFILAKITAVAEKPVRITGRLTLDGIPNFPFHRDPTTLNNRPKKFLMEFSAPMVRASVEQAFYDNNRRCALASDGEPYAKFLDDQVSQTMGIQFVWQSDSKIFLNIARPQGTIIVDFSGAQDKSGRRYDASGNELLSFDTETPQILRKLDFQGKILAQYAIPQTVFSEITVFGDGPYAIANQQINGPDDAAQYPALVSLRGDTANLRFITPIEYWVWAPRPVPLWDPVTPGIMVYNSRQVRSYSIPTILSGNEGKLLYETKAAGQFIHAAAMSPDGLKIAVIKIGKSRDAYKTDARTRFPLDLDLINRTGQKLNHLQLPLTTEQTEVTLTPAWLGWKDSRWLLVEGLPAKGHASSQYLIDTRNGTLQPIEARPYHQVNHLFPSAIPVLEKTGLWKRWTESESIISITPAGPAHLAIGCRRPMSVKGQPEIELLETATGKTRKLGSGHLCGATSCAVWVLVREN